MRTEETSAHIGHGVVYDPGHGEPETGWIERVTDRYVFVRYCGENWPKATPPERLTPLGPFAPWARDWDPPYADRFARALADPERWCISGRCDDTNWGGKDRLHDRSEGCPEFREQEIRDYLTFAKTIDRKRW